MAKASFHKGQRVFVKPVGTWAVIEEVSPQWVKGLDEPLKILYDVGLGREFGASELAADKQANPADDLANTDAWRVMRAQNRWRPANDAEGHPFPGSYPVVVTDEADWGGWRVPTAEYDRDPARIEFQARIIAEAPQLMRLARLAMEAARRDDGGEAEALRAVAKKSADILRRIYDTPTQKAPTAEAAAS